MLPIGLQYDLTKKKEKKKKMITATFAKEKKECFPSSKTK